MASSLSATRATSAGGTVLCETKNERFLRPSCWAMATAFAVAGAVVSNPTARKTTCSAGWCRAISRACRGEVTTSTAAPPDFASSSDVRSPGTLTMSPKVTILVFLRTGDGRGRVDVRAGRHAHRTAGSGNEFDVFRKQGPEAEPAYFHGVRAAHLHDAHAAERMRRRGRSWPAAAVRLMDRKNQRGPLSSAV